MWKDGKFSNCGRTRQKFYCPLKSSKDTDCPYARKSILLQMKVYQKNCLTSSFHVMSFCVSFGLTLTLLCPNAFALIYHTR